MQDELPDARSESWEDAAHIGFAYVPAMKVREIRTQGVPRFSE